MELNPKKIKEISDYIFIESEPERSDLIFIFGARNKKMISIAFNLYRAKFAPKIFVSGGINRITKKNEAERISASLIRMGVNEKDIITENKSINTLENVLFSKSIIEKEFGFGNIKKILFVTKSFHCRRAEMTLKRHFPKSIRYIPIPYDIYGISKKSWFLKAYTRNKVLEEYNNIKQYLERGDIEEL